MAAAHPPAAPEPRLPLGVKLAFGAPTFAGAAMSIPIIVHLTKFYADVVLVPLGVIGLVIAGARAFDAVTDPLVGWLSDRTRTRLGRRRPWMLAGAPLCALGFFALMSPPEALSQGAAVAWFAVSFFLYYLFHTFYLIPHYALGPELTLDYNERSTLYAVREGFLILGTLCAAVAPGVLAAAVGERTAFRVFATVFGVLLAVLYLVLVLRVRERPEFSSRAPSPLVPGIRHMFRNRPFRILLGASLLAQIPGTLAGGLLPFFNAYVIRPENPSTWLAILLAGYFGAGFATLPLWVKAAYRFGKRPVWLTSLAVSTCGSLAFLAIGPGDTALALAILAWSGSAFGAISFLGFALKADVIDYDELLSGRRREAQFTALWSILPKFVLIPGAALPVAILGSVGYVPNAVQTPEVEGALRALFGVGPACFTALAFLVAWRLPIDARIHRALREGVARRARGEAVEDPLTGRRLRPAREEPVDEESRWLLDHFSARELRRVLRFGPRRLVRDVALAAGGAFAFALGAAGWVAVESFDASRRPGPGTVTAVTLAGFAFSLGMFHLLRLRPARAFARQGLADATLRAHLESLEARRTRETLVPSLPSPALGGAGTERSE